MSLSYLEEQRCSMHACRLHKGQTRYCIHCTEVIGRILCISKWSCIMSQLGRRRYQLLKHNNPEIHIHRDVLRTDGSPSKHTLYAVCQGVSTSAIANGFCGHNHLKIQCLKAKMLFGLVMIMRVSNTQHWDLMTCKPADILIRCCENNERLVGDWGNLQTIRLLKLFRACEIKSLKARNSAYCFARTTAWKIVRL